MENDNFELVDRDYVDCTREEYPRQIKTRNKSFHSISQRFANYRIKRLNNKLDKMKNEAVESHYYGSNAEQEIEKKSIAIARLEEKIKVLSKEDVPANYVQKRAIKIKKKMSENMIKNAHDLYSINKQNKNDIFKNEEIEEKEINVETDDLDRKSIEESINEEFSNIDDKEVSPEIGRDAIEESVNEEFANLENNEEIEEYIDKSQTETVSNKDIEDVINKSLEDINPYSENIGNPDSANEYDKNIEEKINPDSILDSEIFNQVDNQNNIDEIKVSRNNSGTTHMYKYDREGNELKDYNYVPMTDEEIREAQIRLGLDENGNFIETPKDKTERKIGTASLVDNKVSPIVLPNLDLKDILLPPKKNIEEIKEFTIVDDNNISENDSSKTLDEYNSLREKILYLKRQKEITKKQKDDAQKTAEETAAKAKEIREMFEQSQHDYAQSLDMLRAYQEELEEDCNRNIKGAAEAEKDTRENNDFISKHREKMNKNNRIISEIGSLIGNDSQDTSKKIR